MSDLRLSNNLNTSAVTGQTQKKNDSYDSWSADYNKFMGRFGGMLADKCSLCETQLFLLQGMRTAALKEGKEDAAKKLEEQISAVEKKIAELKSKEAQQVQQVSAGQILAMQQKPHVTAKPAEEPEKVPLTPEGSFKIRNEAPVTAKPTEAPVAPKPATVSEKVPLTPEGSVKIRSEATGTAKPAEAPVAPKPTEEPEKVYLTPEDTVSFRGEAGEVPYEETITGKSAEALQKCFGEKAVQEILSLLIPEDAVMSKGDAPQTISDVVSLREMLTGTPGKPSHYTRVCTADARSLIIESRRSPDEIQRGFIDTITGSLSDYMNREEIRRGYKTPEEIEARKRENSIDESEERKAIIAKAEDEIITDFIRRYKRPDGTLDRAAYSVMRALRNNGFVPDTAILSLTRECLKKDGKPDAPKVNAICTLKPAGALTDELLPILDLIPRGEDGKYNQSVLQDAADLTKSAIGLPELGELMTLVKDKPAVKSAITAASPYYPYQKAQLKDLVPLMLDKDGNEDPGAASIVKDMAKYSFPSTQKRPAEMSKDIEEKQKAINKVKEDTETILEAVKDEESQTVNPSAANLVSVMLMFGTGVDSMAEIIDGCKDNKGNVNENLSNIAANLVEIGIDEDKIGPYLEKFLYRDGRVDNDGAQKEVEFLAKETETLRQTNEAIKQLQAQADGIRQKIQKRFN